MMISYGQDCEQVRPAQLQGFFEGWPNSPSPETHLKLLRDSDEVFLAWEKERNVVIGFVTALTDGVLAAYIPLLEVLPAYRGQGIGRELMRRILQRLEGLYMIDLMCDARLQPYYAQFGMQPGVGMVVRNFVAQSGSRSSPSR